MNYYIDTANVDDIEDIFAKLRGASADKYFIKFAGITTNPSAFAKIGATSHTDMFRVIEEIDKILSYIPVANIELHTQLPNTNMPVDEAIDFIDNLRDIVCQSSLRIKVAPSLNSQYTQITQRDNFNVTGLSSIQYCISALEMTGVEYASLIPGRMEERGIDSTPHLALWKSLAHSYANRKKYVIAGSMRTVEGVLAASNARMLPTIGKKVWDLMDDSALNALMESLGNFWKDVPNDSSISHFTKTCDVVSGDASAQLTEEFFTTMNSLGEPIYATWKASRNE